MNADRVLMAFLAKLATPEGREQLLDSFDSLSKIRQLTDSEKEVAELVEIHVHLDRKPQIIYRTQE